MRRERDRGTGAPPGPQSLTTRSHPTAGGCWPPNPRAAPLPPRGRQRSWPHTVTLGSGFRYAPREAMAATRGPCPGGQWRNAVACGPGETGGIVAKSASGKTTLASGHHAADLLPRAGDLPRARTCRGCGPERFAPDPQKTCHDRVPGPVRQPEPADDPWNRSSAEGLGWQGVAPTAERPPGWPRISGRGRLETAMMDRYPTKFLGRA